MMANSKLKQVELTLQEWWNALKTPTPVKNKKKYNRKTKHKNKKNEKNIIFYSFMVWAL